jgi:glycosyltransferase involved in cell wall biosynthesis
MNRKEAIQENPGLVNIFVSSYNRAHYLPLAIDSVLAQTYPNYHVIMVDDGSTDGSADIVREYARKYPDKVTAVCKEVNLGLGDSVNRAIALGKQGEFFAFQADDDLWVPDKLEQQVTLFRKYPKIGLVHTEAAIIDAVGNPTGRRFSQEYEVATTDIARHILMRGNFICAPSVVVRTRVFQSFDFQLPPGVNFLCDCFMWLAITSQFPVYYLHEPLTFYRVTSDSVQEKLVDEIRWEIYFVRKQAYSRIDQLQRLVSPEEAASYFAAMAFNHGRRAASNRKYRLMWNCLSAALKEKADFFQFFRVLLIAARSALL